MIRTRRHGQGDAVLHDAGHPRHLARRLVRQHRARRHARRAGRTSTTTAGSCSTSRPTAASATTWPPSIPTSSRNSRRCGSPRPTKYNGLPLADLNIFETLGRWRPYLAGDRKSLHLLPGHRRGRRRRGGRDPRPVVLGARRGDRRHRRCGGRAVQARRGPRWARAVRRRTAGCTTSTTSWAKRSRSCSSPDAVPLGKHTSRRRVTTRTGTVEGSHTPLGDVSLYVDGAEVATRRECETHPGSFGLAGGGSERRPQHRSAGVSGIPGAVRVHRWHHRSGGRRRLRQRRMSDRGARIRAGVREGLTNSMSTIGVSVAAAYALAACAGVGGACAASEGDQSPHGVGRRVARRRRP